MRIIVDSGCTWHIHNCEDDLINLRPCRDVVEDAAGIDRPCTCMGDLPLVLRDKRGQEFHILLRGVRSRERKGRRRLLAM